MSASYASPLASWHAPHPSQPSELPQLWHAAQYLHAVAAAALEADLHMLLHDLQRQCWPVLVEADSEAARPGCGRRLDLPVQCLGLRLSASPQAPEQGHEIALND